MGLFVTDFIRPVSLQDKYPTHLDIYGKGGIHSIDTMAIRNTITKPRRKEGMLSFVKEDNSYYALLGGIENENWIKIAYFYDNIFNFVLPLKHGYIFIGDKNGLAKPSSLLIDIRQDIVDLRRKISNFEELKKLDYNRIWVGNYYNEPTPQLHIGIINLPTLGAATFPLPLSSLDIPIPNPTFNPLSSTDWLMSGPWLPQIFSGNPNTLNTSSETVISSSLAMTQIRSAKNYKLFDNSNFIVGSSTVTFEWDNPAYSLMSINPQLQTILALYNLGTTYTFTKAQSLGNLQTGLLKNTVNNGTGTLSTAISGKDYVDVSDPLQANMQLALIRPELIQEGRDVAKLLSRVTRLPADNMSNLNKDKIWKGGDDNIPIEVDFPIYAPTDAKYVLNVSNDNLPNAQNLSALGSGILKIANFANGIISIASGGKNPLNDDYVRPADLDEEITSRIEADTAIEGTIAALEAEVEAQLLAITGYTILTELTNLIGGGSYVTYAINNTKLAVGDDEGIFSNTSSHIEGSGFLNSDGTTSKKVALKLKHHVNFQTQDQRFSFNTNTDSGQFIINSFTRGNNNVYPLKLGFFTSERVLDLLQPSGDYMVDRGFLFQSEYGFGGDIHQPSKFFFKILKYKDTKTYFSNPTEIENLFYYDRTNENFAFEKEVRLLTKGAIKIPVGTILERPSTGEVGMIRFNTGI